ncbi:MAG: hypothetical protein PHN44_04500 [Candidatus Marinimicrobia bacterium]|jgi:hypothetical protein|nr:hypothetical protein [Candidatus Neomarinimicrobiota bacterium]MDD5540241.1 hypothetical protein [Candidatus Neomarinimicrobiota bacterium]
MSRLLQIAENQSMTTNLVTLTEYPSGINIQDDDNYNALPGLDGEGTIQYPFGDFREFDIEFEAMPVSIYDIGDGSPVYEFKSRKYKTTGLDYYMRVEPETTDTIASVVSDKLTLTTGGLTPNEYQYCDVVDINFEAFLIVSHTEDVLTVLTGGRTPAAGACYIIDRMHNPLKTSTPIKVRFNDVQETLVPNDEEAIYDVVIKCQKVA